MKKTKVTIKVIIIFSILWSISAWLNGKMLEKKIDKLVKNINTYIYNFFPKMRLRVSYQDFKRGIFVSNITFILQSTSQTQDNHILKPGHSIIFHESIYHGPFPLIQLKNFNFLPSMASIYSTLGNTNFVKKLFAINNGKSIFEAQTRVSYDGNINTDIKLFPMKYNDLQKNRSFITNGGNIKFIVDIYHNKIDFSGIISSAIIRVKNQLDIPPILFTLNDLNFDTAIYLSLKGIYLCKQKIRLKNLLANINGKNILQLAGISGRNNFHVNSGNFSAKINYFINKIKIRAQDFGQNNITLKLDNFSKKGITSFYKNYNNQVIALHNNKLLRDNNKLYNKRKREIFFTNLKFLLRGNPSISLDPFHWKNIKGESILKFYVSFKNSASNIIPTDSFAQKIENLLQNMDFQLKLSIDMLHEMLLRVAICEGYSKKQAINLAHDQVKSIAAIGQIFRITKKENNNIKTSIKYFNSKLIMNNEKMPLKNFLERYSLN